MTHNFHPTTLREYDIRGIIDETLGADDAYAIGRGFGSIVVRGGGKCVAVGYDGRLRKRLQRTAHWHGSNADVILCGGSIGQC
jgi:phosphomannomutase